MHASTFRTLAFYLALLSAGFVSAAPVGTANEVSHLMEGSNGFKDATLLDTTTKAKTVSKLALSDRVIPVLIKPPFHIA